MSVIIEFLIALGTSVAGGICGIGGGMILKPLLDLLGTASIATISFLSGMTVLAMSAYRTVQGLCTKESTIDFKMLAPLALGAALGGIAGKMLFEEVKGSFPDADTVGAVQAVCLALISIFTAVFTLNKSGIENRKLSSPGLSLLLGLILGVISSFLGIGGGPINIPVLIYFFSMDSKTASQNSLFIILISQIFSLIYLLVSNRVPEFSFMSLGAMITGSIIGGVISGKISRTISNEKIDRLFVCLLAVIVLICVYNFFKYV